MPPRSTVELLPADVREELDRRLVETAFGSYEVHATWLGEKGHAVSKSALKRYGVRTKAAAAASAAAAHEITAKAIARARMATEMATAMRRAADDDELAVPQATVDMMMMRMQEALANDEMDVQALQKLAQGVNQNMRALAQLREQKELERQAVLEAAKLRFETAGRQHNLPGGAAAAIRKALGAPLGEAEVEAQRAAAKETLRQIREDVYGIHESDPDEAETMPLDGGAGAGISGEVMGEIDKVLMPTPEGKPE